MHIIVCAKQVPETSNVKMDPEKGTMVRDGVESIVNPLDLYALELALQLRESQGGSVTVLSMGPATAVKAVREAIAMGCDDGRLLSDRAFAGSDTHATAHTLAAAVRRLAPFDLVLTGVRATDGDTGQVGPGMASFLGLPVATDVSAILAVGDGRIEVERLTEMGYERVRLATPCVMSVIKEISHPRLPTLRGKQRARDTEVPVLTADDLDVKPEFLGLKGSPTRVVKIERPKVTRGGHIVNADQVGPEAAARELVDFLEAENLL